MIGLPSSLTARDSPITASISLPPSCSRVSSSPRCRPKLQWSDTFASPYDGSTSQVPDIAMSVPPLAPASSSRTSSSPSCPPLPIRPKYPKERKRCAKLRSALIARVTTLWVQPEIRTCSSLSSSSRTESAIFHLAYESKRTTNPAGWPVLVLRTAFDLLKNVSITTFSPPPSRVLPLGLLHLVSRNRLV